MMKTFHWIRSGFLAAAVVAVLLSARATAAPPFGFSLPFTQRVEANPRKAYRLTKENGPWMILAANFSDDGDGADRQAHRLVLELREKYNLPAYTFRTEHDYTEPVQGLGLNKYGGPKMMRHYHNAEYVGVSVLVGDFQSVNDPEVARVLTTLKHAWPESLALRGRNPETHQRFAVFREIQRAITGEADQKKKGPMRAAFVTRNPLIPEEYFAPKGLDPFVVEMNRNVQYSLLKCRGKYSVRVATFRGADTWDAREMQRMQNSQVTSKLAVAAEKAHALTMMLRERRVEAYEFHDRSESIVTIGSFASVGHKRPDGKIEIDPQIHAIMKKYAAGRINLPGQQGAVALKSLNNISYDVQPVPVEVPRASIGAAYAPKNRNW